MAGTGNKARKAKARSTTKAKAATPSTERGTIEGVHHLWVPSADFPASWRFWTEVIGLPVASKWGEGDYAAGSVLAGTAPITVAASKEGFYETLGYPIAYGRAQVFLAVKGIDAEFKRLKKAGANVVRGLHKTHWGPRAFTVEAPDGLRVVFMED